MDTDTFRESWAGDAASNVETAAPPPDVMQEGAESAAVLAYLRQISAVALLTRQDEAALCRRIESAHVALATALLTVPATSRRLAGLRAEAQRDVAAAEDLLQSADGRALTACEIAEALRGLERAQHLAAQPVRGDTIGGAIADVEREVAAVPFGRSCSKGSQQRPAPMETWRRESAESSTSCTA